MKVLVQTIEEVDIKIDYPAYFKADGGSQYALLKNERFMLVVHAFKGMASIQEVPITSGLIEHYVTKGKAVTQEQFAEALLKTTGIFETYFDKNLMASFQVPDEDELKNSLYEFAE